MNSPYSTYYGAKGTGKTTFLKIVKDVLDYNTIATESERKEVNRLEPAQLTEESQYLVLTFDFSNFDAKDIGTAEKDANCQTLLVILESINAILDESEIEDNHFLLNGNYEMWKQLCNATCWDDLNA